MSILSIRKNNGGQMAPATTEWDPARLMRDIFRWDPFREMAPLMTPEMQAFAPAFEVKETKEGYVFRADLPGVKESDLDVTMKDNRLQITGKREAEKEDKGETYYTYERSYGSFSRAFTLPEGVDSANVHAELKDGVLNLMVPKKAGSEAKKISVTTAAKKS